MSIDSLLSKAFLFLLFHVPAVVLAQTAPCTLVLRGTVIDEHDGSALAFAEIFLPEVQRQVTAGADGRYVIEGLCAGSYLVRVAHVGCDPLERRIALLHDAVFDLKLEHHSEELRELEVARKRPDEHVGNAHNTIDKGMMEAHSGRSLAEMLVDIPGVTMLSSGPTIAKPMIHGLFGNRILTLNQGIRQEDQQWGTEHAPNLDPFSSDAITVVKGAASVQYGSDAMGGVVITEPVELPREAGLSGAVRGVGLLNGRGGGGNAMLQGGVRGLRGIGWRIQGTGRLLGDSKAPEYLLSNTGLNEQGISTSVGYRDHRLDASIYYSWFARELGILRASHIGNLTDLENAISSGEPWYIGDFTYDIAAPRQTVQHHLLKVGSGYAVSERNRIVLTYGYQADDRKEYDIRRGDRSDIPALDLYLTTHTADAEFKHWIGARVHGKVGFNGVYQRNINVAGTGIRPLIPNYEKHTGGVFWIEHVPLSSELELEVGARLERTQLHVAKYTLGGMLIEPRPEFTNHAVGIGANWTVRDSVRTRFNVATAYRPPHVSELYSEGLHHGAAAIENGNDQLTSERSVKATADLEASWFRGRLRTDLTMYVDRIGNYIYLRPDGLQLTIRGAFPVFDYVATNALLHGLDVALRYQLAPRWSIGSRSSFVRGRDLVRKEWLFQMPSDRTMTTLLYRMPKVGKWKWLELGASSSLVGEQTRIPAGVDFAPPPKSYHLLGLQFSTSRPLGRNELRLGLQVNNMLNTSYRDYLDRFRYYADARGTDVTFWITYDIGKK